MPGHPQSLLASEYVDDIPSARKFYTEVMGLEVQREHPAFVQFESFAIAADEVVSGKRQLELYWVVDDVDAARTAALRAGAKISVELKELLFGRVVAFEGPTGEPRFLLQWAAQRPSQAV